MELKNVDLVNTASDMMETKKKISKCRGCRCRTHPKTLANKINKPVVRKGTSTPLPVSHNTNRFEWPYN